MWREIDLTKQEDPIRASDNDDDDVVVVVVVVESDEGGNPAETRTTLSIHLS